MNLLTPIDQIKLHSGSSITIPSMTWQDFENLLEKLGEHRKIRLLYNQNNLKMMSPSPEHERSKILISDIVKILLKKQQKPWEALGSTTFKKKTMQAGVEPDECFYIANYQAVIGKNRIDLDYDPPPDLVIESDITSFTEISAYARLEVPELWIYEKNKITIYVLQGQDYQESEESSIFPEMAVKETIMNVLQQAKIVGSSQALQALETSLR